MRRPNAVLRAFHACVILLAILAVGAAHDAWARTREAVAKDARLAGDRGRTRFEPENPYGYQNLKGWWLSEACDPLGAN